MVDRGARDAGGGGERESGDRAGDVGESGSAPAGGDGDVLNTPSVRAFGRAARVGGIEGVARRFIGRATGREGRTIASREY